MDTFGARLHAAVRERGPLCVGIDPHATLLSAWGLPDTAYGLERFAMTTVEALADQVAVLKPQSAFFERHGGAGVQVLERTIAAARSAGALVLLDVKRGDIGSTAQAYADAYLGPTSPLAADAVTVSPYLGFGSLLPFLDVAAEHGRGVFVLALTSNPEGASVQQAVGPAGTVAGSVLAALLELNAGATPLGSFGAVVGATIGSTTEDLDINGPLLAPGFGAQGATVEDLHAVFGASLPRVLPATSRELLRTGPDVASLRAEADRVATTLSGVTTRACSHPPLGHRAPLT
ncbi:MAG: orotidine-5'-phosphate decarboxylase [Actinomycetota bacterium]|nr:orotidine-5'-phosphate decarboxylase [Actinomycetota bacterium]